jgi:tRNA modification GTPase
MTWLVKNKIDMSTASKRQQDRQQQRQSILSESEFTFTTAFQLSAVRGDGMDVLLRALIGYCQAFFDSGEPALVTRARHRTVLLDVQDALMRCTADGISQREDLVAEELRLAARGLGRLTGRVDVEDVLDVIFRDFCIGK